MRRFVALTKFLALLGGVSLLVASYALLHRMGKFIGAKKAFADTPAGGTTTSDGGDSSGSGSGGSGDSS